MSHVTTCELEIKDLAALEEAAQRLGMELVKGKKTYKWWGRYMGDYNDPLVKQLGIDPKDFGRCEHVLRRKDKQAYEVGVVRNPNGEGYILMYDFYSGGLGLMEAISTDGKTPNLLKQEYAAAVTTKELRRNGFRVNTTRANGKIKLTARR